MKQTLAKPQPSSQPSYTESEGDPYFLNNTPIVDPLFAPAKSPISREIAEPVAKLEAFLNHPTVETMELAQEGAATLCALMERIKPRHQAGGRENFRRDFAVATLEQLGALVPRDENVGVLENMLRETGGYGPRRLSESLLAGVTDLNEALGARLRRSYSREGGLCDRLAQKFEEVIDYTQEIRNTYRRKTSRRFDGSEPAAKIRGALDPILAEATAAMMLVPPGRALVPRYEERVANTLARLGDYHFADATRLMEGLVGDMRELKHVFRVVEGLDKGQGSKLEASRQRRAARPAEALS